MPAANAGRFDPYRRGPLRGEEVHALFAHAVPRSRHRLSRGTRGALKLKEISYIHAEGYAAGEMKHGPIALIDEDMPVVALCPRDAQYDKTFSNMQEVKAREGQIIAVCTQGDRDIRAMLVADAIAPRGARASAPPLSRHPRDPGRGAGGAPAPDGDSAAAPRIFMADLKGTDVDQPRNLAKTVTVE